MLTNRKGSIWTCNWYVYTAYIRMVHSRWEAKLVDRYNIAPYWQPCYYSRGKCRVLHISSVLKWLQSKSAGPCFRFISLFQWVSVLLSSHFSVTGSCVAVVDYSPAGPDELQLSRGDAVEILGLLLQGLGVFIGTHSSTGRTGFVHKTHVRPLDVSPL